MKFSAAIGVLGLLASTNALRMPSHQKKINHLQNIQESADINKIFESVDGDVNVGLTNGQFVQLVTNGGGLASEAVPAFDLLDVNKDGVVSTQELQRVEQLPKNEENMEGVPA